MIIHYPAQKRKPIEWERNLRGCYLVTSRARNMASGGHIQIWFNKRLEPIHKLFYRYVYGDIPKGLVVRHKCDNSHCINLNHLELGTQADNIKDMDIRGRRHFPKGILNAKAKLTEDQVKEIRALKGKVSRRELQERYGISKANMCKIINNTLWTHV